MQRSDSPSSLFSLDDTPPIPGLFFDPFIRIPNDLAQSILDFCLDKYFISPDINQIMLFGNGIPTQLYQLLDAISLILKSELPDNVHELLFPAEPKRARQAILNLYEPGEGISPHIDLLNRFGDGILGVSLSSGCAMHFTRDEASHDLYLPERSILVLTQEARYEWTHEIERRKGDWVQDEWVERGRRLSLTFRWLLPGAEIVGDDTGRERDDGKGY